MAKGSVYECRGPFPTFRLDHPLYCYRPIAWGGRARVSARELAARYDLPEGVVDEAIRGHPDFGVTIFEVGRGPRPEAAHQEARAPESSPTTSGEAANSESSAPVLNPEPDDSLAGSSDRVAASDEGGTGANSPLVCPECGQGPFQSRFRLGWHRATKHGLKL